MQSFNIKAMNIPKLVQMIFNSILSMLLISHGVYNIACFPWMSQFNCYHLQLVYLTMEHHPLRNLWHKTVQTTLETFDESQHLCTMHSIFFFLPYICSFIFLEKMKHAAAAAAAKSLQSCLTLCDPRDGSPPGFPIPGILQARTLEWVAMSFSNAWKWKVNMSYQLELGCW